MYPPPQHQSEDIQKMIEVIRQYPLGMLVSSSAGIPFITHIPIIYNSESGMLVAHIDKANPQLATLTDGAEVTVVFRGPDAYISPSVYTTKQLPTWNYIIVHVTGTIVLLHDREATKDTMIAMTEFLEAPAHEYALKKEDPNMDRLVQYIQAFEIKITNWEGKFKLSQDKIPGDFENAKAVLKKTASQDRSHFIDSIYR